MIETVPATHIVWTNQTDEESGEDTFKLSAKEAREFVKRTHTEWWMHCCHQDSNPMLFKAEIRRIDSGLVVWSYEEEFDASQKEELPLPDFSNV